MAPKKKKQKIIPEAEKKISNLFSEIEHKKEKEETKKEPKEEPKEEGLGCLFPDSD